MPSVDGPDKCFQNLQLQILKTIPDEELKDIFLEAIREPLRCREVQKFHIKSLQ